MILFVILVCGCATQNNHVQKQQTDRLILPSKPHWDQPFTIVAITKAKYPFIDLQCYTFEANEFQEAKAGRRVNFLLKNQILWVPGGSITCDAILYEEDRGWKNWKVITAKTFSVNGL